MLALSTQGTGAKSVGWCRSDPVVLIDSIPADVFISVNATDLPRISGPTEIVITLPLGVHYMLVGPGVGFGYGEQVTFVQSELLKVTLHGIEVRIDVYVPAKGKLPVLVEFAPRIVGVLAPASAEGVANEWISLDALQ